MVLRVSLSMAVLFPEAWASETVGSSITARELVMADGKSTRGSAMPVSVP